MCSADWQPGVIKVRPRDAQAEVTPRCLHTLPASASQGACLFPSRSVALLKAAVKDHLQFRKAQVLPGSDPGRQELAGCAQWGCATASKACRCVSRPSTMVQLLEDRSLKRSGGNSRAFCLQIFSLPQAAVTIANGKHSMRSMLQGWGGLGRLGGGCVDLSVANLVWWERSVAPAANTVPYGRRWPALDQNKHIRQALLGPLKSRTIYKKIQEWTERKYQNLFDILKIKNIFIIDLMLLLFSLFVL